MLAWRNDALDDVVAGRREDKREANETTRYLIGKLLSQPIRKLSFVRKNSDS